MPRRGTRADFAAGRWASAKAAEQYAQRARDGAVSRRYGSLADQADRHAGRPRRRGQPTQHRAKSLAQQSKEWREGTKRRRPRARKPSPGGYKSDDPARQATSRNYGIGAGHGIRDCQIVGNCPPGSPLGPDPEIEWSAMYRAGYRDEWAKANPHQCTKECRKSTLE